MIEHESVERICNEIREAGAKEVSSILDKARHTAKDILARAEEKAKEAGNKLIRAANDKGELEKRRILSSVNLEVRRIKLRAREEVVKAAMALVEREIESARSRSDYPEILTTLAAEAIGALEGDQFVVYADRRDLVTLESKVFPKIRELMGAEGRNIKSLKAEPLSQSVRGGVLVSIPGGKVIFDNTFETRLYRFREEARASIFSEVFSPQESL